MERRKKIAALSVLVAILAIVSGLSARAGEDLCWDCLISTRTPEPESNKSEAGDVITCRPCGWEWGESELKGPFRVQRISGITRDEAAALEEPALGNSGEILRPHRFSVGDKPVEADKVVVTDHKAGEVLASPKDAPTALAADTFTGLSPDEFLKALGE